MYIYIRERKKKRGKKKRKRNKFFLIIFLSFRNFQTIRQRITIVYFSFFFPFFLLFFLPNEHYISSVECTRRYVCVCTYIKRGRGYPSNLLFTNNTYDGYHGNTHHKYFLLFFFFKKKNEKILDSRSDNVQYRLSLYRYNRSIINR